MMNLIILVLLLMTVFIFSIGLYYLFLRKNKNNVTRILGYTYLLMAMISVVVTWYVW
ncbi:hypothetical protein [Sporosarcina trichiuri]|uniref:hypothetical protein n=1 Tax=Sporosarcina trichiuri TaxID=3056445 RepID=UPI0025B2B876|nr:hypothetical protein [Sporosarcina sp. 0.2-SM1T-5]WJY26110.1 hypothetical protein QWT68_08420 [Sporosarcina sp. 0.2-SM1T-5]